MLKDRMATIWELVKGVVIKEVEKGVFVFRFFHKLDMQRVVNGGPWMFDNHLLILGQIAANEMPAPAFISHKFLGSGARAAGWLHVSRGWKESELMYMRIRV